MRRAKIGEFCLGSGKIARYAARPLVERTGQFGEWLLVFFVLEVTKFESSLAHCDMLPRLLQATDVKALCRPLARLPLLDWRSEVVGGGGGGG